MKKTLSLFVALLLLLSSFAALAEGDTPKDTWLCDEKTTLTVLTYDAASNTMPAPSNDLPFWAWLEDYTNVHIEWEVIPQASYNEVLSARLSAGEGLADIVNVLSSNMMVNAGNSGTFVDLAAYWDEYCPNLQAYFDGADLPYKDLITTPEGNIYGLFGTINETNNRITALYNTAWLEKLGLSVPTTLEEFDALLVAISEAGDLNGNGLDDEIPLTSADFGNSLLCWMGLAFGMHMYEGGNSMQLDADGKIYDERVEECMKNTLTYLNDLYARGLLDPEICNMNYELMSQKNAADRVGVMIMYSSFAPAYGAMCPAGEADPLGEHLTVGTSLKSEYNGNEIRMYRNENLGGAAAITATSENVELAIRWLDTLIASEAALTTRCWGFEGEDFEYDANGEKVLIQPADGSKWNINPKGCGQIALPHLQTDEQLDNPDSNLPWYIEQCHALNDDSVWFGPAVPNVMRTAYELETESFYNTDVSTYYTEMRDKFVKGEASIEAEWDSYVSTMNSLGLSELIEVYQSIYDRTR